LTARCAGTKRDGSPCTATVEVPQTYCWWHDPANAEQRRRAAAKAGKSKPNREIQNLKTRLSKLADDVLEEQVERGVGAVASQILKVKEVEDLEIRLEELEQAFKQQNKGKRYGAYGS
jgi:hypothetical protein